MNTTITIPTRVRDKLKAFGNKGEIYSDIIRRLLKSANNKILHDYLMDDKNSVPIEEAIAEAKRKWRK